MKGILFQPWKAEAIRLSGTDRDWQTRRVMKPQPDAGTAPHLANRLYMVAIGTDRCWKPRYNPGEVAYIKERWDPAVWPFQWWKSPIFMPASAARTFLLITGVRVERTADISTADCVAEGIWEWPDWWKYGTLERQEALSEQECYFRLYDSINGAGAHERNWDWAYSFRRVEGEVK